MKKLIPLLSAALMSAALVSAQAEHALKIGDAAPPLKVGKWIKGEPVKAVEAGKLHVLEFWATWCGPCVAAIPHVSELQKKHADVVFIGVNVWEDDPEKVEGFGSDTPLGRAGHPVEVAAAYVFLASDEASFVSGTVLGVTGGKPVF